HDRGRKRQPERVKRRQTNLDLRQVRPVILAVSKLKQRVIAHSGVSLAGRRIHSHQLRLQVVDAQQFAIQFLLEWTPPFQVAKLIEKAGQSVVAEIERTNGLATERLQQAQTLLGPSLKVREPMIALREDKAQPDGDDFSSAQLASPVSMLRKVLVNEPMTPIARTCAQSSGMSSIRSIPRISISLLIIAPSLLAQGHFEKPDLK